MSARPGCPCGPGWACWPVFKEEMPYRDPHTAGPGLWALRHSQGYDFEASTTTCDVLPAGRKGLEALAVSLYRQAHGGSPTVNFGRIIPGYRASSGNNARLVSRGNRFRGGPDQNAVAPATTVPVHGPLLGDPTGGEWMGWDWSPWQTAHQTAGTAPTGLYRLGRAGSATLTYVGQGRIYDRVAAHLAKAAVAGHRQGTLFSAPIEVSWVGLDAPVVHLLAHENDLIASHVLTVRSSPSAQFLG